MTSLKIGRGILDQVKSTNNMRSFSYEDIERRYVFVCGMPRSGTSMLGRNIGRLVDCTDLKNTGTRADEGQNLQNVYPTAHELGGPGRFGFDPRAHRTESSTLLTPEKVSELKIELAQVLG